MFSFFKNLKYGLLAWFAGFMAFLTAGTASAETAGFLAGVQTAITGATGDALTVGGYVVLGLAGLVVVSLSMKLINKL